MRRAGTLQYNPYSAIGSLSAGSAHSYVICIVTETRSINHSKSIRQIPERIVSRAVTLLVYCIPGFLSLLPVCSCSVVHEHSIIPVGICIQVHMKHDGLNLDVLSCDQIRPRLLRRIFPVVGIVGQLWYTCLQDMQSVILKRRNALVQLCLSIQTYIIGARRLLHYKSQPMKQRPCIQLDIA